MKLLIFAAAVVFAAMALTVKPSGQAPRHGIAGIADAVKGYPSWKVANEKLFQVSKPVWILCRPPSPEEQKKLDDDTHAGYIRVFVSKQGEAAMFSRKPFPVGTILVKERHKTKDAPAEFCTVMRKREKGYNPQCGDWEFAILDPEGRAVKSGKLEDCMSCHRSQKNLDFTYRTYLGQGLGDPFNPWG